MPFDATWLPRAIKDFNDLKAASEKAAATRKATGKKKSSKQEGLFKQVNKALLQLLNDPKHPGLNAHEYDSIQHPYDLKQKVWEAYAQNNAPGAYRIFWCYGPGKNQITFIAITPHP